MKSAITALLLSACLQCTAQAPEAQVRERSQQARVMNRITFSFPNFLVLNTAPGLTIGLDYERFLDPGGTFSAAVGGRVLNAGDVKAYGSKTGSIHRNHRGYAATAAAACHPLGNRRRIDPAIGGGIMVGNLRSCERVAGMPAANTERDMALTALFGQLSMNINSRSLFSFGLELRAGPVFGEGLHGGSIVEFGMKIGARF